MNGHNITVLIPVCDDRLLDATINSVLHQQYNKLEILILCNGCSRTDDGDDGRETVVSSDGRVVIKNIFISQKGKANALNVGIEKASYDLICVLDADCILESKALKLATQHFRYKDVVAVGGYMAVVNNCDTVLTIAQQCEYRNTFQIDRSIYERLDGQCLISGAFGIFRKCALVGIGGYDINTVGEDMEIVMRLQDGGDGRSHNKIAYEKNAVCYTAVPSTLKKLLRQRERWQRGLMDCMRKHSNMLSVRKYGTLGIAMMYQAIVMLYGPYILPIIAVLSIAVQWLCGIDLHLGIMAGAYIAVNIVYSLVAMFIEAGRKLTILIHQLPKVIVATIVLIILQIPINLVRIYGMIHFEERRMKW